MTIGHTTFFHIYSGDVWVCAVTRQNVNAALVFEFLRKVWARATRWCASVSAPRRMPSVCMCVCVRGHASSRNSERNLKASTNLL